MKLRLILTAGLVFGLAMSGCDKKEEEEAKKAAAAAAEQAKKAEEEAKKKVEEAGKQVEEASKAAEEAVKKAEEEAKAKLAAAEAEAAKKVEEAKTTATADAEKAAAEKAAAEAAAAAEAEKAKILAQKDTLVQLAVDIGCLKKKETDAQKMQKEESDLLVAAEMDQRTFLNSVEALKAADAEASKQIDEAVGACPTAEDVIRGKVLGVQVLNVCLREAKVKPERMGAIQKEILETYGLTAEEFNKLRDQYKDEPWFKPSLDEGVKSCPPVAEEDLETAEETSAKVEKDDTGKPKPRPIQQSLKGTLFGSANGKLAVHLAGARISSGNAQFGDISLGLSGYVMEGGKITFKGASGGNFVRGFGKFDGNGARIVGNWNGTLNGQRKSGSFILHR